jgi:fibronectin-binding autotransporter adhesin
MTVDHFQRLDSISHALSAAPSGRRDARRRPLLISTALGCSLMVVAAPGPARAQAISQNSDTDISITQSVVTAGPVAVDAVSTGGNITIDIGQAKVTNNGANAGYGIGAVAQAPDKLVSISVDEITATGTGRIFGIIAQAPGGSDILVNAGAIEATGNGGYGIWGVGSSGSITIDAGTVTTTGGILATPGGARASNGVWATTGTGAVSITADSISTTGVGSNGILADSASGDVVIDSGVISTANTFAPGIQAKGHDITITSDQIQTTGGASPGIYVPVATGGVVIDSGAIQTSGGPAAANGVTYVSAGIAAIAVAGDLSITSDTITTSGGGAPGIYGNADGELSVVSGSVTTGGNAARGIEVEGLGGVTISSESVTTTGNFAVFNGETLDATGIYAASDGPIVIDSGAVSTNGGLSNGIHAEGGAGAITIDSDEITTAGMGAFGIRAEGDGAITVTSGSIVNTGDNVIEGERPDASGIYAGSNNGPIVIDSGSVVTEGTLVHGIWAESHGAISITSDELSTSGDSAQGILAHTDLGDITIVAGRTATSGDYITTAVNYDEFFPDAITAISESGDISITSEHASADGLYASAIVALTSGGGDILIDSGLATGESNGGAVIYADGTAGEGADVVVISDSIVASGNAQGALTAVSTGDVTITSGSIVSTGGLFQGFSPTALVAESSAGDVVVTSGAISTAGDRTVGIIANAEAGSVSVTSDEITTQSARGVMVSAAGEITIDSGSVHSAVPGGGSGAHAIMVTAGEGAVIINSEEIVTDGGLSNGIHVANVDTSSYGRRAATGGTGALTIDSGTITTTGGGAWGIAVDHIGPISITSDEIDSAGAGIHVHGGDTVDIVSGLVATQHGPGIIVYGDDGAVSVTSGDVLVGAGSDVGIYVRTNAGDVLIDAGHTTTTALNMPAGFTADGVGAVSNTGDITITSVAVNTRGESTSGIYAFTDGHASITSGSVVNTGANGNGIIASAGSLDIDSGTISTTGDNGPGIWVNALDGDVSIISDEIETSGLKSNGINIGEDAWLNYGGREATGGTGALSIDSGSITVSGLASMGIAVDHQGSFSITSDSITAESGSGMYLWGGGDITVDSGAIEAGIVGIVAFGAGDIDVTSGSILMGEFGDTGIYAESGSGDVTIDAGTTTMTALGVPFDEYVSNAVFAFSDTGDVSITSDDASTVGDYGVAVGARGYNIVIDSGVASSTGVIGRGVYARSRGGSTSVTSDSATVSGDGGIAVFAAAVTDLTLNSGVASSSGDRVISGETTYWSHAIYGEAGSGSIDATVGDTTATGAVADGIYLMASGADGAIDLKVRGDVSSANAHGVTAVSSGEILVDITAGNSVSGATTGLNLVGAGSEITNAGLIASVGGPAIVTNGPSLLINSGTINGAAGQAVQFDSSDDAVVLKTGSSISGGVLGGDGHDMVELIGTSAASTETQSLAHFEGFEELYVTSGYWTATGHESAFDSVTIGAAGGLEVRDFLTNDGYYSAVATGSVVNNGVLIINFSQGAEDTEGLSITGTGILRLAGAGTFNLTTDTIAHTGGTIIDAGKLVLLTDGLQGDLVINPNGTFQIGDGGTEGSFAGNILDNGTLIFDRSDDYEFTGGLYGSGSLVKKGDSELVLSGDYGFAGTTTVLGGTLKLANISPDAELELNGGTLDLTDGEFEVAGLSGDGGTVDVDGGSLTVNVTGTDVFDGVITGEGSITISGGGTLNLTGDSTYTGPTSVASGVLKVNGSIVSDVFITQGGTLGGNGTVADVNVGDGGAVGPGNSIGLLDVVGDIAFAEGSIYEVEVNAAGQSDKIVATGDANLTGGTVEVLAEAGLYNRLTTYTILTAAGGVNGEFDDVTTNFAYLTASLDYTANDVLLTLARNDLAFSEIAATANQAAVADAIHAAGEGDLFDNILFQSEAGAQAAFDALSGELYGAQTTALLAQSRYSREATLDRLRSAEGGSGVWAAAYGTHQTWDAGDAAAARNNLGGVMLGADMGVGAWRVGAAVGQERSRTKTPALAGRSETETTTVAAYGGFGMGPLSARLGVSHAMHDVEANRDVVFPTFADATTADYEGTTTQLFGEVGYKMPLVGGTVEPFANVAMASVKTDAFTETGGAAALTVEESEREVVFSSVGARFTVEAQLPLGVASPYIQLAYGNASGDTDGVSAAAFDTGEGFAVTGASLSDNAVLLDTGFDWKISDNAEAGFGYQGSFGDDADEQSVRVEFSLKF